MDRFLRNFLYQDLFLILSGIDYIIVVLARLFHVNRVDVAEVCILGVLLVSDVKYTWIIVFSRPLFS